MVLIFILNSHAEIDNFNDLDLTFIKYVFVNHALGQREMMMMMMMMMTMMMTMMHRQRGQ